jgi:hypothetical protein
MHDAGGYKIFNKRDGRAADDDLFAFLTHLSF